MSKLYDPPERLVAVIDICPCVAIQVFFYKYVNLDKISSEVKIYLLGVDVGVEVGVRVTLSWVGVIVGVGVLVLVTVGVGVLVLVTVGVFVVVVVGVIVCVGVNDIVGVSVVVGVSVGVSVTVDVGVGVRYSKLPIHSKKKVWNEDSQFKKYGIVFTSHSKK